MKNLSAKEYFIGSFLRESGLSENNYTLLLLAGDGSTRIFQRLSPKDTELTYVLMENPPENDFLEKENQAYLEIGNHMYARRIPLPKILKHDLNTGYFILEDMGDRTLQDEALNDKQRINKYENVIETLLKLQIDGKEGFDTAWCCQTPFYDSTLMREKEAWYFRDSFLRDYVNVKMDLAILDDSFDHLISMAEKAGKSYLLHRDFQSRNIMCRSKGIAVIDWQGARLGPLAYDLASLIFDPYVDLPEKEKSHLMEVYSTLLKERSNDSYELFKKYFLYIAVMRNLQVLGAYSFLSLKQGKKYFEKYIPVALKSLNAFLEEIPGNRILPLMDLLKGLNM